MSKFSKKFVSAALTATTALWMMSATFVPIASAQTTSGLQAQINALLSQISQLQAQLAANQGGAAVSSCSFTRDLTVGVKGTDVTCLQNVLIAGGHLGAGLNTGYFGQLTKAAVAKWQAKVGVSPTAGYFGSKSRAAFAAGTGGVIPPVGGVIPPVGGVGGIVLPSGVSVALAPDNPSAGAMISSLISAAARVPVLAVTFTAGAASGVTISDIKFRKTGVVSDSSLSGAYLVEGGKVLTQYTSISGGVIDFASLGLNLAAGQTREFTLAIDPAVNLNAGNTVGFSLASAADIASADATGAAVNEAGAFPLIGNIFTITTVSNPAIASITVASSSIGTTVTAGSQNLLVGAWNFTASNSKVYLKSINFKVIGSATKTDLRNVKLIVNGTQAGATLASVASDGSAYFDLTASPATVNTGSNNVQIYADVMGSPSFNFQFEILNSYDIYVVDSQYNVPISTASNTGTQVTINQGQITVTASSDTPTGNVAKSQSGVTLAKFSIYAAGEPVKVKFLGFNITLTDATSTLVSTQIKNVSLVDDAGGQVGSTINTPPTTNACDPKVSGTTGASYTSSTGLYADCFGTSASPINYIIPANTTRVLSLKADIQSSAGFSKVVAMLTGNTSNLQGLTSSQTASSASVTGSSLTLAASSLTVAANSGVGTQKFSKGAANRRIGSYAFTASTAEGVNVNNASVLMSAAAADFTNLKVMVGSQQIGTTQGVLTANATYSFAGNFTVPNGQTSYVDVYADVLSGATAGTDSALTTLSGCSGSGATSYTAISCTSTGGQSVTIAGAASVQVAANSALSPSTGQIVMGSTGVTLAAFQFNETTNIEDIKVTDLKIMDVTAGSASFTDLKFYKSTDLVNAIGSAGAGTASISTTTSNGGPGYYYSFHFTTPVVVPQAGSVSLVLKGNVSTYASAGATDNATHALKISTTTDTGNTLTTSTVTALGNTSNVASDVSLVSAAGNQQTILRSKLTATAAALNGTTRAGKVAANDIGTITFTADSAGAVALNTVTLTITGSAASSSNYVVGVDLLDMNGVSITGTTGVVSSTGSYSCVSGTCSKTWSLGNGRLGWPISGSYTFKVRVNDTIGQGALANIAQGLSIAVNAYTDVAYTDAQDASGTLNVYLPPNAVPININSVSFPTGS